MSLIIIVFLSQTKVNNINLPSMYSTTNKEVFRLNITVNKGFRVDIFKIRNKLISKK